MDAINNDIVAASFVDVPNTVRVDLCKSARLPPLSPGLIPGRDMGAVGTPVEEGDDLGQFSP
jgi:hypothetical protein